MLLNAIIEKNEFGYFAYVPTLQGCMSQGETYEEILKNIKEAIELYLESLETDELALISNKNAAIVPIEVTING
ncbi:type II toxin-antitoxin system HicB family antitoxin [Helicobacter suis]|uniref:type II toxin-antitoxin system HicB family antitoxin n=1 Tax=Helicobacter suis TaxID=104628 RepID=UPI0013D1AF89|nr:type II toxin-antitoxin system HicB family antitoxin [Helicobacter suis]